MRALGWRFARLGRQIDSTGMEGMTAREAAGTQPRSAQCAEALDAHEHVLGAARTEAANWPEQR